MPSGILEVGLSFAHNIDHCSEALRDIDTITHHRPTDSQPASSCLLLLLPLLLLRMARKA